MKDINRVTLIGRLTRDAELKAASSGLSVCRFSIAVNRSKKQGNDYADEANFFDVTLFGKQADSLSRYLLKGKRVCIDGELQQDRWQQDGQNRSKVGIAANSVQLLDGQEQRPAARKQAEPPEECDDYIPF